MLSGEHIGQAWDNVEGGVSSPFWLSASTVERKGKMSHWGRPGKGDKGGKNRNNSAHGQGRAVLAVGTCCIQGQVPAAAGVTPGD